MIKRLNDEEIYNEKDIASYLKPDIFVGAVLCNTSSECELALDRGFWCNGTSRMDCSHAQRFQFLEFDKLRNWL